MGDRDLGPRGHRDDADPKTESNNVPGIMKIHNGDQEEDYRGNSAIPEADCGDANAGERGAGQVQMVASIKEIFSFSCL